MGQQRQGLEYHKFLSDKNIKLGKSDFLSNHYAKKSLAIKLSDDPRDPFGKRLHHMWQPGDTIISVIWKKVKHNTKRLLDPDTYSHQSLREKGEQITKYKAKYIGFMLCLSFPIFIIAPLVRPRYLKVKRDFLFQYYLQTQTIARKLKTGNKNLTVQEVEEIIKRAEQNAKL